MSSRVEAGSGPLKQGDPIRTFPSLPSVATEVLAPWPGTYCPLSSSLRLFSPSLVGLSWSPVDLSTCFLVPRGLGLSGLWVSHTIKTQAQTRYLGSLGVSEPHHPSVWFPIGPPFCLTLCPLLTRSLFLKPTSRVLSLHSLSLPPVSVLLPPCPPVSSISP